jgi:dipeptidyl aminopeptidase/acylaminoacyl peptidase
MREDGYEADRLRVMIYEIESGQRWDATPSWDRSPSAIVWAPNGKKVFLQAEDQGHVKVFELDVPQPDSEGLNSTAAKEPKPLTSEHSVAHIEALADDRLLVTWSSLTTPNQVSVLEHASADKTSPPALRPLATLTKSLRESKTLCEGEEFWFAGDGGEQIHGWILFPPEAQQLRAAGGGGKGKKWPLAFLCHGGPQSAWNDSWSTRCESPSRLYSVARFLTRNSCVQGTPTLGQGTAISSSPSTGAAVPDLDKTFATRSRTIGVALRSGYVSCSTHLCDLGN